jgi:hypothetical protein
MIKETVWSLAMPFFFGKRLDASDPFNFSTTVAAPCPRAWTAIYHSE